MDGYLYNELNVGKRDFVNSTLPRRLTTSSIFQLCYKKVRPNERKRLGIYVCRHKTNFVGLPLVNENFWSVPGQVYFDF